MELKLDSRLTPFDLESTLQCGQLFRWQKHGDWWCGVVEQRVFKVRQVSNVLEFGGASADFVARYFRLDDNLPRIASEICRDSLIRQAIREFHGLRIVRQNPWECLISYVCATYKSIPAIRNMISKLSQRFGKKITFEGSEFYTFPTPSELAKASLDGLRECGLGFRARRVQETAKIVEGNRIDFEALKKADYETVKGELTRIPGVGNKVADCILLFSLDKLEAFPVDVWMKRVIQKHYADYFDATFIAKLSEKSSLSPRAYVEIGSFARGYFGKHAGYAQEYLFHFARSREAKSSS